MLKLRADERAKATQWIRKLISKESSMSGSQYNKLNFIHTLIHTYRYARDHYAGLLLATLREGHLKQHPFTSTPPQGPLCIPSYNESLVGTCHRLPCLNSPSIYTREMNWRQFFSPSLRTIWLSLVPLRMSQLILGPVSHCPLLLDSPQMYR